MDAPEIADHEIDLVELFAALWSHAFTIAAVTLASPMLATYYAMAAATPFFEAKSTFVLNESSGGPSLGELGGFAPLVGPIAGQRRRARCHDRGPYHGPWLHSGSGRTGGAI